MTDGLWDRIGRAQQRAESSRIWAENIAAQIRDVDDLIEGTDELEVRERTRNDGSVRYEVRSAGGQGRGFATREHAEMIARAPGRLWQTLNRLERLTRDVLDLTGQDTPAPNPTPTDTGADYADHHGQQIDPDNDQQATGQPDPTTTAAALNAFGQGMISAADRLIEGLQSLQRDPVVQMRLPAAAEEASEGVRFVERTGAGGGAKFVEMTGAERAVREGLRKWNETQAPASGYDQSAAVDGDDADDPDVLRLQIDRTNARIAEHRQGLIDEERLLIEQRGRLAAATDAPRFTVGGNVAGSAEFVVKDEEQVPVEYEEIEEPDGFAADRDAVDGEVRAASAAYDRIRRVQADLVRKQRQELSRLAKRRSEQRGDLWIPEAMRLEGSIEDGTARFVDEDPIPHEQNDEEQCAAFDGPRGGRCQRAAGHEGLHDDLHADGEPCDSDDEDSDDQCQSHERPDGVQCQRVRGHDGEHQYTSSDGQTGVNWSEGGEQHDAALADTLTQYRSRDTGRRVTMALCDEHARTLLADLRRQGVGSGSMEIGGLFTCDLCAGGPDEDEPGDERHPDPDPDPEPQPHTGVPDGQGGYYEADEEPLDLQPQPLLDPASRTACGQETEPGSEIGCSKAPGHQGEHGGIGQDVGEFEPPTLQLHVTSYGLRSHDGQHTLHWDATDDEGLPYRLEAPEGTPFMAMRPADYRESLVLDWNRGEYDSEDGKTRIVLTGDEIAAMNRNRERDREQQGDEWAPPRPRTTAGVKYVDEQEARSFLFLRLWAGVPGEISQAAQDAGNTVREFAASMGVPVAVMLMVTPKAAIAVENVTAPADEMCGAENPNGAGKCDRPAGHDEMHAVDTDEDGPGWAWPQTPDEQQEDESIVPKRHTMRRLDDLPETGGVYAKGGPVERSETETSLDGGQRCAAVTPMGRCRLTEQHEGRHSVSTRPLGSCGSQLIDPPGPKCTKPDGHEGRHSWQAERPVLARDEQRCEAGDDGTRCRFVAGHYGDHDLVPSKS